jgi:DNA helicase-2/ATP-dependent DNA helicase PcrA
LVKQFELALRVLANPLDRLHVGLLAKAWGVSVRPEEIYAKRDPREVTGMDVLTAMLSSATCDDAKVVGEAVRSLQWTTSDFKLTLGLEYLGEFAKSLDERARSGIEQDVKEWKQHWDYYVRSETGGSHSVGTFLSQVALGTTQQPQQAGVALLTVHSAKGMEFDVVFVIGMCEGVFPDYRAGNVSAMNEERRNAFVAATRSRRLLYLTFPRNRLMPWGDVKRQSPSRFLKPIAEALAKE